MDRRTFLECSVLAAGAIARAPLSFAQPSSAAVRLTLNPRKSTYPIPADFAGLSYETSQLADPQFFTTGNTELAGFIRRLGRSGVLRIGGNTSEFCYWSPETAPAQDADTRNRDAATVLEQAIGPDTGKGPAIPRKITPLAVRNLRGFIDATGWKLIYGLNMGTGTAEAAADEAAFVMKTFGEKLIAFQLCNEPDLFYRNGIRKSDYDFAQFATEWQHFYEVIRKRMPNAPFAGPDTAFNNEWLVPFAKRFSGHAAFLSQHYYAEGPPADPSMTIDRLLRPNPNLVAEFEGMAQTRQDSKLPFRLTETNSCYQAGKQGVSDTFASALWGGDLMFQLASVGGIGINFHGGGYGWYTPIAGTPTNGFVARPIYYGMLLFAEAAPGHLIESVIDTQQDDPLLTAYGLRSDIGAVKGVVFNKNADRAVRLTVDPGTRTAKATALRLFAPRLSDTTDVTLGGNPVGASGAWSGEYEAVPIHGGAAVIDLPPASAALLSFA